MIYQEFSFDVIINNSTISEDAYQNETINYLKSFIEYLRTIKKLSDSSIKIYVERLLTKFLNNGYSLADLLGFLDKSISNYAPGGKDYDEKDHGNTLSALKHLREFYWQDKLPNYISISIYSGWQSFAANHSNHVTFSMENNIVHEPKQQKTSDYDFYCIQELIFKNYKYLAPSNNALTTFHGPAGYYNYVIGKTLNDTNPAKGSYCRGLFFSKDKSDEDYVKTLNNKFIQIIKKYL